MSLIDKVKALLGLDETPPPRPADDVGVTVEHEPTPDVETEAAVKTEELIEEAEPEPDVEEPEPEPDVEDAEPDSAVEEPEPEPAPDERDPEEPEPAPDASEPAGEDGSDDPVTDLKGIGASYGDRLADADIETVGDLAAADVDDVADRTGISAKRLTRWVDRAKDH